MNPRNPPCPTDLYRYFDKDGTLLYVGISWSAIIRATRHRDRAHWWNAVASMTREVHPTRGDAAERHAIMSERPLHNVVHNRLRSRPPVEASGERTWVFDHEINHLGYSADWQAALLLLSAVIRDQEQKAAQGDDEALTVDEIATAAAQAVKALHMQHVCRYEEGVPLAPIRVALVDGNTRCDYFCLRCGGSNRAVWDGDHTRLETAS